MPISNRKHASAKTPLLPLEISKTVTNSDTARIISPKPGKHIHVRRRKVMTGLAGLLLLTLLLSPLASAKRTAPVHVDPVVYEGIRYVAPNDDGRRGYIEAWNVGTNKKVWGINNLY